MPVSRPWSAWRAALVGLAVALAFTAATPLLPDTLQATADATVLYGKDDDKNKKEEREKREKQENADRVLQGQVLEIDTLKNPPELVIGSVDGATIIRVLKTDEIVRNGVRLGDYIEASGEKIHEQLFEATALSVAEHYSDLSTENDNNE